MLWLALQYLGYLVAAVLLGALVGWLWWGRGLRHVRRVATAETSALRMEAATAKEDVRRSAVSLAGLRDEIDQLQRRSQAHLEELAVVRTRHEEARAEIDRARSTFAANAAQLDTLTQRVRQLEPQLDESNRDRESLSGRLGSVSARADAAALELVGLRNDLADVRAAFGAMERQRTQLSSALAEADARAEAARSQVDQLAGQHQAEVDALHHETSQQIADAVARADAAERELEWVRSSLGATSERAATAERALLEARQELAALEARHHDEIEARRAQLDELTRSASVAVAAADDAAQRARQAEAALAASQQQLDQARSQLTHTQDQLDSSQQELTGTREQLVGAHAQLDDHATRLAAQAEQLDQAASAAEATQLQLHGEDTRSLIGALRRQWVQATTRHQAAERRAQVAGRELTRLQQELQQLRQVTAGAHGETHASLVRQTRRADALAAELAELHETHGRLREQHESVTAQLRTVEDQLVGSTQAFEARHGDTEAAHRAALAEWEQERQEQQHTLTQLRNDVDDLWAELTAADDERQRVTAELAATVESGEQARVHGDELVSSLSAAAERATAQAQQWQRELQQLRDVHQRAAAAALAEQTRLRAALSRAEQQLAEQQVAHRVEIERLVGELHHRHQAELQGVQAGAEAGRLAALATATASFEARLQAVAADAQARGHAVARTDAERDAEEVRAQITSKFSEDLALAKADAQAHAGALRIAHQAELAEHQRRLAEVVAQHQERHDDLATAHRDALERAEALARLAHDAQESSARAAEQAEDRHRAALEALHAQHMQHTTELTAGLAAQLTTGFGSTMARRLDVAHADARREEAAAKDAALQAASAADAVQTTARAAARHALDAADAAEQRRASVARELAQLRDRHRRQLAEHASLMARTVPATGMALRTDVRNGDLVAGDHEVRSDAGQPAPRRLAPADGPRLPVADIDLRVDAESTMGTPSDTRIESTDPTSTGIPVTTIDVTTIDVTDGAMPSSTVASAAVPSTVEPTHLAPSSGSHAAGQHAATVQPSSNGPGAASVPGTGLDDLERIEGIGPKIQAALRVAGITSFVRLASAPDDQLRDALVSAGLVFAPSLGTWSRQAAFLVSGDDEGFEAYVAELVAGRSLGTATGVR